VAHNQAVVLPSLWSQLDQGDPAAYRDGGVDMVELDGAGNAYVLAAREHVLEAVAWLAREAEAGEGRVKARQAEPIQILSLLQRASHQPKGESQTQRARE